MSARRNPWRALARCRDGSVAMEFAVVGGFMILMMVGIADYTLPLWRQQQIANAARAGATYAALKGWNSANITTAATSATQLTGLSVTPTRYFGCPNAAASALTSVASGSVCGAPLTGSPTAGTYVTVAVTYTYTPFVPFVYRPTALSASATARVQ
jgi:Flp pilus assembly protein TadG